MIATPLKASKQKSLLEQVAFFAQKGNLNQGKFEELDRLLSAIANEIRDGNLSDQDISDIRNCFDEEFLKGTIHGHGLLKPNGYAGDYLLLDKIYTRHTSNNLNFRVWDEYFQQHAAPRAVRNRKAYFKNWAKAKAEATQNLNLLNVVSGSGRELAELHQSTPAAKRISTTCLEIDEHAIDYAKWLNVGHLDKVNFIHSNIFRYKTNDQYDLIWSAGLFDYLTDRAFVRLLQKFKGWLKEGGEMVVGNYNQDHNPSRDYMEVLGDWFLIHRTADELLDLAIQAGFESSRISVGKETENVILFLHIKI